MRFKGQSTLIDFTVSRCRDCRLADECFTPVAQDQAVLLDTGVIFSLLGMRVLDLEKIGEVAAGIQANRHVDRFIFVVEERQFPVETIGYGALPYDRERS